MSHMELFPSTTFVRYNRSLPELKNHKMLHLEMFPSVTFDICNCKYSGFHTNLLFFNFMLSVITIYNISSHMTMFPSMTIFRTSEAPLKPKPPNACTKKSYK